MFQFLLLKVVGLNLKILWTFQQIYKSAEALEYFQTTKEKKIISTCKFTKVFQRRGKSKAPSDSFPISLASGGGGIKKYR